MRSIIDDQQFDFIDGCITNKFMFYSLEFLHFLANR